MKKSSILVASVAMALAGCGDKEVAVAPEAVDRAAQDPAAEVAAVVAETRSPETDDTAVAIDMEPPAPAPVETVVEAATETAAAVPEEPIREAAAAGPTEAAEPDLAQGKKVYSKNCFACHGSGAAGAPKLGDTENWAPRIAQGMDTMAGHAIAGFKGAAGYMPPKGGFMALSDAEVTAAVAYMVSESR